jgi:hypothetical protein
VDFRGGAGLDTASYVLADRSVIVTTVLVDDAGGDIVNCGDGDDQAFVPPSTSLRECERTPFIGKLDPARL